MFAGADTSCVIRDSTLLCSGSNLDGQLGLSKETFQTTVYEYSDLALRDVALGDSHSLIQQADYTDFQAAGTNEDGECGGGPSGPQRIFKPFGINLATSTTFTFTVTYTTVTTTVTTVTITSIRQIAGDQDNASDDAQMLEMLQVLMLMGVVAIAIGAVIRRVTDSQPANTVDVETPPQVQELGERSPSNTNSARGPAVIGALSVVQEQPSTASATTSNRMEFSMDGVRSIEI